MKTCRLQSCGAAGSGLYGRLRRRFYVTEESWAATALPIGGVVRLDSKTGTQGTVEGTLRGIDDHACVPRPNNQVAGLGLRHSTKIRSVAGEEISRSLVLIRIAGLVVNSVHKVRAIRATFRFVTGFERGAQNREAIVEVQQVRSQSRLRCLRQGIAGWHFCGLWGLRAYYARNRQQQRCSD